MFTMFSLKKQNMFLDKLVIATNLFLIRMYKRLTFHYKKKYFWISTESWFHRRFRNLPRIILKNIIDMIQITYWQRKELKQIYENL